VNSTGSDVLGNYKEYTLDWLAGTYKWQTSIKTYFPSPFIVFTQTFSDNLTNVATGDQDDVSNAFPSFIMENTQFHYFTYTGIFAAGHTGMWNPKSNYPGGLQGGSPLALFDSNLATIVISPLDHFMVGIQTRSKSLGTNFACGIQGKIASIPGGYSHSTIIAAAQGVNNAFDYWGSLLLKAYDKKPKTIEDDFSVKYLGYWTDNGAYYYYLTEPGKTYADTMIDVYDYINSIKLPVKYYQFDSWWYFRGATNGLVLWEPKPDIFPNGMTDLMNKMGNKPLVLHNRWFENDNDYITKMKYPFVVEGGFALPTTTEAYVYLMTKAKSWGMIVYEQDWLITTFNTMEATRTDIQLAEMWMTNMNSAAKTVGVTIQLCMPLPVHILQSVAMSQVTQIRASNDYQRIVYDITQWAIGYSSILHDALGVFPFKDCFYSNNSIQTGCVDKNCEEPNALLQTIVALLSTGPVGPADKIGYLSVVNLMQTTRTDGVLLKPDRPARAMDKVFSMGFELSPTLWNLTSTHSNHMIRDDDTNPSFNWVYVLAADTFTSISLMPKDLGYDDSQTYFVFDYFQNPTVLNRFSSDTPLVIPALTPSGTTVSWKYYVAFPVLDTYSLIGERNKFAVASNQRFSKISKVTSNGTTVTTIGVMGEAQEKVMIEMLHVSSRQVESYTCTIPASGAATLTCTESTSAHSCSC